VSDAAAGRVPRILHLHSTFAAGGKEVRCARLMNAWGPRLHHSIVSAEPQAMEAAALVAPEVPVEYPQDFPSLKGRPAPARLERLARAMRGYDLICTYNWGAMDAVMAHRIFARRFSLPPLIHHEDGFNEEEAAGLKPARNLFRRIALGRAARLVVPSQVLETIAREAWHHPAARIARIPNGIDTSAFAAPPLSSGLPFPKEHGQFWVGTLAGLRPVKRLPDLVAAFDNLPPEWHLVICGEGPEREAIRARAAALGIAARVHLTGNVDAVRVVGLFDIFALSSASEQFPLSVVEAMAAGLPVAATDVGDIAAILAPENAALLTRPNDPRGLGETLAVLAADPDLRARLGAANAVRARAHFDSAAMLAAYEAVYAQGMGRAF